MRIIKFNKYDRARYKKRFLFWLMEKIARSLGDSGTKELRYLASKIEYKEAYEGWKEFKKDSNKGKSLSECLSKEEIKEYKTIILYKK